MNLVSAITLSLSISADAFAAAVSKGVKLQRPKLADALRVGAVFGITETITPLLGWGLGLAASNLVQQLDHWFAFGILCAIGLKMLAESVRTPRDDAAAPTSRPHLSVLLLTAIGTSIDALAIGATLAFLDANIVVMALAMGFATFCMATLGILLGHRIGQRGGHIAEALGGLCLIAIGTHILLAHLGLL